MASAKMTVPKISARKVRMGEDALAMVTAYDAPGARAASEAGIDMILVGDSVAMVVLGYDDTLQVTIDDMAHHTRAVARAKPDCLIVGDLPWMSYHVSVEETVRNAAELIRAGAQCVKLEGGRKRLPMIEALIDAEIPVMGHIGRIRRERIDRLLLEIGVAPDELRDETILDAEEVVVHEHLPVAMRTGADADRRNVDRVGDRLRHLDWNALEHDREAPGVLQCLRVLDQLHRRLGLTTLHLEAANFVH